MLKKLIILHTIMSDNTKPYKNLTLDYSQNVGEAIQCILDTNGKALPVVDKEVYLGLLFLDDIQDLDKDKALSSIGFLFKAISLKEDYTFFDWYKCCSLYNLTSIPLVSSKRNKYKGNISIEDIFETYRESSLTVETSTILVIQKESNAFSYSEVFQIIETNGAKVLATFIAHSDEFKTEVILKILHTGLNELLQSFRRYDFEIISFHEEDLHNETLKDNSDYLSKYLTV